jgi:acyl dehydratase
MTAPHPGPVSTAEVPLLTRGRRWQEQPVGFTFRTGARTITDADVVGFVNVAGYFAPTFIDLRPQADSVYRGRVVPGLFTVSLAEGLVFQTNVIFGTGIAFLGLELDIRKPVYTGDTIEVIVEVIESRPTSDGTRGIVRTRNVVVNQRGDEALIYSPSRLIRGGE